MPRPNHSKSHASPRRRSGGRVAGCALAFTACLAPELARADLATARTELAAAPADRRPLRDGGSLAFTEPAPVAAARRPTPPVDALELRVSYRAPGGCPSSGAFLAALQQHVAAGGGGAVDADVIIARASASEFELRLRLQVAGKSSESVTRAESCEALMQLAALNASMARTTLPERNQLAAPPPPPQIEPSPPLEAPLPVATAPRADAAEAASTTSDKGSFLRGVRPFVSGELRTLSGMLPRQAWGQGISVGVERGAASLRLGATLWRGQQGSFAPERTSDVLLDFEQRSLELSPCAGHPLSGVLRVDGCALLAAHQVSTNGASARTIGSLGASARATLTPWRGLRIELEGGLSAALERPRFGVQSEPYLYQPEVLQPGARAALGWEFGGGN